jgi:RNA:NAD 2'-phosphotransferase (TPT1/KptA family)
MAAEFWPGWCTHEVQQALERIDEGRRSCQTARKWRTVLLMADAVAQGRALSEVLRDPRTCSRVAWYGKTGKAGWRSDPAVAEALRLATERATRWHGARVAREIEKARERLGLEAVANVETMIRSRDGLEEVARDPKTPAVVKVRAWAEAAGAAGNMLDRAGEETATKAGGEVRVRFVRPSEGEGEP